MQTEEIIEFLKTPRDHKDTGQYVDGVSGEDNIARKFKEQYAKLYSSLGSKMKLRTSSWMYLAKYWPPIMQSMRWTN